jgi:hypothetical protein
MAETVNHPPHYTAHPSGVEAIDVCEHLSFNVGNAVKYIWRAGRKGQNRLEDLKKAEWYFAREEARLLAPPTVMGFMRNIGVFFVGLLNNRADNRTPIEPEWHQLARRVIAQDELLLGKVLNALCNAQDELHGVRMAGMALQRELEREMQGT